MSLRSIAFSGLTAIASLAGCGGNWVPITGSGTLETTAVAHTGFTKVGVSHGCKATIVQGDEYRVHVTVDDNLVAYLNTRVEGSSLIIGFDGQHSYHPTNFSATIVCPKFNGGAGSGGSVLTVSGFESTTNGTIALSGGSALAGEWTCGDLKADLSGGSSIRMTGRGRNLEANFSGGSQGFLGSFTIENARANLSGGSAVRVNASGTIQGNLSGGSYFFYRGSPTIGSFAMSGGSQLLRE